MRRWTVCLICLAFGPLESLAQTCFGATFNTVGNGFEYRAQLNMPEECGTNGTRATRLFIAGACGIQHNNNFNGFPPACPPGDTNIMDSSSATCERVFAYAHPFDIRNVTGNETFDEGSICNNGINSVLFVQTNCSLLTASSVVLSQRLLDHEFCWDGKTLSEGQLAGIVIGSVVGACVLLSVPVLILVYLRRRRRRREMKEAWRVACESPVWFPSCVYSKQSAADNLPEDDLADADAFDPSFDYNSRNKDKVELKEEAMQAEWSRYPCTMFHDYRTMTEAIIMPLDINSILILGVRS